MWSAPLRSSRETAGVMAGESNIDVWCVFACLFSVGTIDAPNVVPLFEAILRLLEYSLLSRR